MSPRSPQTQREFFKTCRGLRGPWGHARDPAFRGLFGVHPVLGTAGTRWGPWGQNRNKSQSQRRDGLPVYRAESGAGL